MPEPRPTPPSGLTAHYCGFVECLRLSLTREVPPESRRWFFAAALCGPLLLRALVICQGAIVVHYSLILRSIGRIQGMRYLDLEVGPCWTRVEYRGQGLFQFAIRAICSDLAREGRAFWMVCRQDNHPSKRAIAKAGFRAMGAARRQEHRGVVLHRYSLLEPSATLDSVPIKEDWRDLQEEKARYNRASRDKSDSPNPVPEVLREPYDYYHRAIGKFIYAKSVVLDVCCGEGLHTLPTALRCDQVYGVDVAEKSLDNARKEGHRHGVNIRVVASLGSVLPFADRTFDVITCAGGLSYMPATEFTAEMVRVLKPNGHAVVIDSFDENPFYKVNRFLHWLRGNRSKNTLSRVPNHRTIALLRRHFHAVDVKYFGILSFMHPILVPLFGASSTAAFIHHTDRLMRPFSKYAFKIVIEAAKPRQESRETGTISAEGHKGMAKLTQQNIGADVVVFPNTARSKVCRSGEGVPLAERRTGCGIPQRNEQWRPH